MPRMNVAAPREDRLSLGIGIMCGAVMSFSMIDTSAKWLMLAGLPALQVVLARYAGHFLLSCLITLPREGLAAFRSHSPWRQLLRSLFLMASTVLNFMALKYLPITVTTTIFFAGPIVVSLLSMPILGERVGPRRLAAVLVGFLGVLVVIQPFGVAFHPAMFLSLGALFCSSLYFIMTRLLAGIETNATSQLWSSGIATAMIAPMAIREWVWPDDTAVWIVMALIGFWGIVGHTALTTANRFADASLLAPVVYLQLVVATLAGLLLFDTAPTRWTLIGAAIIVGSGIYIWARERRLDKPPLPPAHQ
jgi:drug/metabolite transporter (DMT)-like permease